MARRYFEDFAPGQVIELGSRTIDAESIMAFGREYDPQPFHTDPAAAAQTVFGGLIASGWQTAGIQMRLLVDGLLSQTVSMGSSGVDELRWLKPVRPGDTLSLRVTVVEATPSKSRADRGTLRFKSEVLNQKDETVMTVIGTLLIGRRP
jgi:acyl dehydratase